MSDTTPNPFQSPYPGVRRIITGHKPSGEATVIRDELKPPVIWDPAVPAPVYSVYQSNETPAKNDAEFTPQGWVDTMPDLPGPDSIISRNGSTLRVFDLQPGAVSVSVFDTIM